MGTKSIITPSTSDALALLEGRAKNYPNLDASTFSYQLPGGYALDTPVVGSLDIDESEMSMFVPIANGTNKDGVGDVLEVTGINTSRHILNPIVSYNHFKEVHLPIARARRDPKDVSTYTFVIDAVNKTAGCKAYFYQGEKDCGLTGTCKTGTHSAFCAELFDMCCKGLVQAGSIGYTVVQGTPTEPDYVRGLPAGVHLLKTLLLECAVVVLPANSLTVARTSKQLAALDYISKALTGGRINGSAPSEYFVKAFTPYLPEKRAQVVGGYQTKALPLQTKAGVSSQVPNYRKAQDPDQSCETCGAYTSHGGQFGKCNMFNTTVGPEDVCDRWYAKHGEKGLPMKTKAAPQGPLGNIERDDTERRWAARDADGDEALFSDQRLGGMKAALAAALKFRDKTKPSKEQIQAALDEYRQQAQPQATPPQEAQPEPDLPEGGDEPFRGWQDYPPELEPEGGFPEDEEERTISSNQPPVPGEPTQAQPGSEDKLRVMENRAEGGEQLQHPKDPRIKRPLGGKPPLPQDPERVNLPPELADAPIQHLNDPDFETPYEPNEIVEKLREQNIAKTEGRPKKESALTKDPAKEKRERQTAELLRRRAEAKKPKESAPQESPTPQESSQEGKAMHGPQCKCAKCMKRYGQKDCGCSSCSNGHACPCGTKAADNTGGSPPPPPPQKPPTQRRSATIHPEDANQYTQKPTQRRSARIDLPGRDYDLPQKAMKYFSPNDYAWNGKSLDNLRKKYRQPTGKFHRSKRAVPGAIHMHIKTPDLDNLRNDAGSRGCEVRWISDDGKGTSKIKLTGMDQILEELAKKYGKAVRKVKSLPNQKGKATNVIGTIEPDDKATQGDPVVSRSRASLGNLDDSLLNSEGGTEEGGRPKHTGVLTARGEKAMNKKVTIETEHDENAMGPIPGGKKKPTDGGPQGVVGEEKPGQDYSPSSREQKPEITDAEPETDKPSGPYGAQVVRRLHADMAGLLHEYDEFLENLEDESTRQIVLEQIHHFIDSLEKLEEHASTHERYKELFKNEPLEGAKEFSEAATDANEADSGLMEEKLESPEGVIEGLNETPEEDEVDPKDALAGMSLDGDMKTLYHKHVKGLRQKHKKYPKEEMEEKQEEMEERKDDQKSLYLRKHLANLGNKSDPASKKMRAFLIKQLLKSQKGKDNETLLQGKDKEHKPGHEAADGSEMDVTPGKKGKKALPSDKADVSPEKARKILKDGETNGKPLSDKQRGMFGAIAGKKD